ncbi:helix-turn-helix domain-containing transcriptional regulator [Pseudomonas oryzihabitans]|uniref:Uncharacterized protein n=1 Tax=Pseudomonas oryzihabitans TaxID=47885 RepID=A0ABX3ITF8_9PSED|nr:hypothetical protein [Pseudomonas psychrotolerans]ONN71080.1 hypothetical protein BVL52_11290 [Pseudomonas psychrotolerans]
MANARISIRDWDVADYLKTEEEIALFLETARELDPRHSAYMERVLREVARARKLNAVETTLDTETPDWTARMVGESVHFDKLPPPLQHKLDK